MSTLHKPVGKSKEEREQVRTNWCVCVQKKNNANLQNKLPLGNGLMHTWKFKRGGGQKQIIFQKNKI